MSRQDAGEPLIRALIVQSESIGIGALPPPLREVICSQLPPEALGVDKGAMLDWLPLSRLTTMMDVARQALDPEMFRKLQKDVALVYLQRPLLRGLVETSLRLFGRNPSFILRWAPRAWDMVFRNCGRLEYQAASGGSWLWLRLRDFPREALASGSFVVALAAAFEAPFTLTETTGRVEIVSSDEATREATFAVQVD